ncbi:MAG TPA: PhnD/SsuA/transferrin family substrate-binding protein [Holophaga sp.]|nr:PhnD/SsuA/transferrin family substrate-binding protein [Holophaga sp.]
MIRHPFLLLLTFVLAITPAWSAEPLRMGILAFRPREQALAQWKPFAVLLSRKLGRPVEVLPCTYPELNEAVRTHQVQAVLTNPGHYVLLDHRYGISAPLASLVVLEQGYSLTAFGGVILARADRKDATLASIKGSRIATVGTESLGGFQAQAFELLEAGLPLPTPRQLVVTGMPHDRIVEAVLSGDADFGFARTGLVEAMVREGKLDSSRIKVVHPMPRPGFPFATSTRLYPEWPVAVVAGTDPDLAKRLAIALLSVDPGDEAAKAANIGGFQIPADYSTVEALLRGIRMPPFDVQRPLTASDLWRMYRGSFLAAGAMFLALAGLGVTLLILNRRLRESRLHATRERQRLEEVIWGTDAGTWEWDMRTGQIEVNARWAELLGCTLEEITPVSLQTLADRMHPDDRATLDPWLEAFAAQASESFQQTFRVRRTGEGWSWVLARGRIVDHAPGGRPVRAAGTLLDVDAQKEAERKLRASEYFFKESQRAASIGSYRYDIQTDHWDASEVLDEIFGIGDGYPRGLQGWLDLVHPEDQAGMAAYFAGQTSKGATEFHHQYRILRPGTDETRWVEGQGHFHYQPDGSPAYLIGTIRDISEQRRIEAEKAHLQTQLAQSQKLESLGSLAGGVAHDMNNVLAAIMALASVHKARTDLDPALARDLGTIEVACQRGANMVKGLLTYTRKGLAETRSVDLNATVRDLTALLERTTLQKVQVDLDLAPDLKPILGDQAALHHCLMNLCVNSVAAMPSGGRLTIRTHNHGLNATSLEVQDTGVGMPPEVLKRATDPFFTTKGPGTGTGLGLSIVESTVANHRGHLNITSEVGVGTRVTMVFPALEEADPARPEGERMAGTGPEALRVLLVDDDELILMAVPPLVEALGHHCATALGGGAALEALRERPLPDLVILDMNMPDMDGGEVLAGIRRECPDLQVLLSTGKADQRVLDLVSQDRHVALLPKPFTKEDMARELDRVGALGA